MRSRPRMDVEMLERRRVVPSWLPAHRLSRFAGESYPPPDRNTLYRPVQICEAAFCETGRLAHVACEAFCGVVIVGWESLGAGCAPRWRSNSAVAGALFALRVNTACARGSDTPTPKWGEACSLPSSIRTSRAHSLDSASIAHRPRTATSEVGTTQKFSLVQQLRQLLGVELTTTQPCPIGRA